MASIQGGQAILASLGLPQAQQNEMSALTLLALCSLGPVHAWRQAKRRPMTVTKGTMDFVATNYDRRYAANTRETFRRQVLHHFVQAGLAEYNPFEPDLPTNSPKAHYAISEVALDAVKAYESEGWPEALERFLDEKGSLVARHARSRSRRMVPVTTPTGESVKLSPGAHSRLEAEIVQEFAPRFCPGGALLYMGDTAKKGLYVAESELAELGVPISEHG